MPVTQGRGLDVSANGQVAPDQSVRGCTEYFEYKSSATEASADISMDAVAEAVVESTELSQEADMENQDGEPQEEPDEPQEEPMDEPEKLLKSLLKSRPPIPKSPPRSQTNPVPNLRKLQLSQPLSHLKSLWPLNHRLKEMLP